MEFQNKELQNIYEKIKEVKELTIIQISEMMAMTSKRILIVDRLEKGSSYYGENLNIIYKEPRKRKLYILGINSNNIKNTLLFKGLRNDIKTDSDCEGVMRGNALLNLGHEVETIKNLVENENLNDYLNKAYLLAVGENNDKEVPVYPEVETSHAVMSRIKEKLES